MHSCGLRNLGWVVNGPNTLSTKVHREWIVNARWPWTMSINADSQPCKTNLASTRHTHPPQVSQHTGINNSTPSYARPCRSIGTLFPSSVLVSTQIHRISPCTGLQATFFERRIGACVSARILSAFRVQCELWSTQRRAVSNWTHVLEPETNRVEGADESLAYSTRPCNWGCCTNG